MSHQLAEVLRRISSVERQQTYSLLHGQEQQPPMQDAPRMSASDTRRYVSQVLPGFNLPGQDYFVGSTEGSGRASGAPPAATGIPPDDAEDLPDPSILLSNKGHLDLSAYLNDPPSDPVQQGIVESATHDTQSLPLGPVVQPESSQLSAHLIVTVTTSASTTSSVVTTSSSSSTPLSVTASVLSAGSKCSTLPSSAPPMAVHALHTLSASGASQSNQGDVVDLSTSGTRQMHPSGFTAPSGLAPAVFDVNLNNLPPDGLLTAQGQPVGSSQQWASTLSSVSTVGESASTEVPPARSSAPSAPPAPRPKLLVPLPVPQPPSVPASAPLPTSGSADLPIVVDSSAESTPGSTPQDERARLLASARRNDASDPEVPREDQRYNMRQLRLFVADVLPLLVPLPVFQEDPTGATGSAIVDRAHASSRRDQEREKELKRALPISPMVVAQAQGMSAWLQGRTERDVPTAGDTLDDLINPECMDQTKRSFTATSPAHWGLSTVSYAVRESAYGPKERWVEAPRLDPNFEACGGVPYKDKPSDDEEIARMGLRVLSTLDLLLAAAITGASSEKEQDRVLAADALQASLHATSHAATLFHRIAANNELRRRESALRRLPLDPPARLQLRSLPLGGTTLFHGKLARAREEAKRREKDGVTKISQPERPRSRSSGTKSTQQASGSSTGKGRGGSSASRGGSNANSRSGSPRREQAKSNPGQPKQEQKKRDKRPRSSGRGKGKQKP